MSPDEIERYVRLAREIGIRSIKFTGGEPLVRKDLEDIVDRCVRHISDVSLTTNGSMLAKRAETLRSAGLKRVNVSMDSLSPELFKDLRHGDVSQVMQGIDEALKVGLKPVKVNFVVMKQTVQHIPSMIDYVGTKRGLKLQLIQFMPELVNHDEWSTDINEIKDWLEARAESVIVREMHHRRIYQLNGTEVEVVDPVRNPEFCANCHRIRLTHDARLKGCLNRGDGLLSLRGLDDNGIRGAIKYVVTNRVPYYGPRIKALGRGAASKSGSFRSGQFLSP